MAEKLVYLGLCVAATLFAAHFPVRERRAASVLAFALLANWLFCEWTYANVSPQHLVGLTGLQVSGVDLWAVADGACGILALRLAMWRLWGWALWGIAAAQCVVHAFYAGNAFGAEAYTALLDKLLLAAVAVFLLKGAPGVRDYYANALARFGRRGVAVHQSGTEGMGSPKAPETGLIAHLKRRRRNRTIATALRHS